MSTQCIHDKEGFNKTAGSFLTSMFSQSLTQGLGQIELRVFPKNQRPHQDFFTSIDDAVNRAYELCIRGIDVYVGVNPRNGGGGRKENIDYIAAFHAEIDYGHAGHKKKPIYKSYDEAYRAIDEFSPAPTLINHSGGGFHCYWLLHPPVAVKEVGIEYLENINKSLSMNLGGDQGTHDISRVLRVPGTCNFKVADKPREVTVIKDNGQIYPLEDFKYFETYEDHASEQSEIEDVEALTSAPTEINPDTTIDVDDLPVPDKIKSLICKGNDGTYPSRSEADMAVILSLVNKGVIDADIKTIFMHLPIGEKYRGHGSPNSYLTHSIKAAKNVTGLTDEEGLNPLFVSGSLCKKDEKDVLEIVKYEEYMARKYRLLYLEKANSFFRYNGKCYEYCSEETINSMCQAELSVYRRLFSKNALRDFIHYLIGDKLIKSEKAHADQTQYLTLQNGLYDIATGTLGPHTPEIFTTNLLPYDFDPHATCPRFLAYLDEVFLGKMDIIGFVQESVGYIFQKDIPKPSLFFLIGSGSNGKSVFVNTLTSLVGEENTCSISLNSFSNEYYLLGLFNKMLNVSSETPKKKYIDTDVVKAVVAGDWVTGRVPYKPPTKFKSSAKHFLAMNEAPVIEDTSHGMWRRLYIINFPRRFSEQEMDVHLTEKLQSELSGIFNCYETG